MPTMNTETTVVPLSVKRDDGVWLATIQCPFCARRHIHGLGNGDQPVAGHRESHCSRTGRERRQRGYVIQLDNSNH